MKYQVLLYYHYGHLTDAAELLVSQRALCQRLGLTGRLLIAEEGMNGTLEGTVEATEEYVAELKKDVRFRNIHMKRSVGTGNAFPKLMVKLRSEIVSAYLGDDDFNPADHTAPFISPEELHSWIHSDKELYIVDMRNSYEHLSGHFAGSVLPKDFRNFRDLPAILPQIEHLKGKTVVTVCTGGVRCEKASGFLLNKGFKEVYQLYGGIVSYMEKYPNQDFLGKLYVFDNRVTMGFNTDQPDHTVVGRCAYCDVPCERYVNDDDAEGRPHFICCAACSETRPSLIPA
ncbi:MAG TPA: rhodanese-related sulfurtransferase [Verrucomicrobiae bacterium]|nr:rhodanese-related sulfurtransferase [Verrucomicrobiae bacterium]